MEWADITEEYANGLLNTDTLLTATAIENTTSVGTTLSVDIAPSEIGTKVERDGEISPAH